MLDVIDVDIGRGAEGGCLETRLERCNVNAKSNTQATSSLKYCPYETRMMQCYTDLIVWYPGVRHALWWASRERQSTDLDDHRYSCSSREISNVGLVPIIRSTHYNEVFHVRTAKRTIIACQGCVPFRTCLGASTIATTWPTPTHPILIKVADSRIRSHHEIIRLSIVSHCLNNQSAHRRATPCLQSIGKVAWASTQMHSSTFKYICRFNNNNKRLLGQGYSDYATLDHEAAVDW